MRGDTAVLAYITGKVVCYDLSFIDDNDTLTDGFHFLHDMG